MDSPATLAVLDRAEALCRARGVRLTAQRRRVLAILCDSPRPLGAYEILDTMCEGSRPLAPPTVYRALDFLLEQGLVHKLVSLHAFVGCNHPEHPHSSQFLIIPSILTRVSFSSATPAARSPRSRTRRLIAASVPRLG